MTRDPPARVRGLLLGILALVVTADVAQPLLLPWRPKFAGALAGAALYAACAWGIGRGARWPLWVVAVLPVLPVTVLLLHAAGAHLPVAPDGPMRAVLALQLLAAALAGHLLRARGRDAAP